jgi:hypothetical protein
VRPAGDRAIHSLSVSDWTIRHIADSTDKFGEDAVYSLGLAEFPDEPDAGLALIFSLAEPDRDDAGYSLVAEPGQRTAYRALNACELTGSVLSLELTESAATALRLPARVLLRLAVDDAQLVVLERGLERVGVRVT